MCERVSVCVRACVHACVPLPETRESNVDEIWLRVRYDVSFSTLKLAGVYLSAQQPVKQ